MPAPDDWRLTVALEGHARLPFMRRLSETHLASTLRKQLDASAIVTHGDGHIYAYLASAAAARATEALARELLADVDADAELVIEHWHPIEQRWEPPEVPLPRTEEELAAEHARQQADEAAAARALGHAEWEVMVELPSHADAVAIARLLTEQGRPVVRRWSYVLVGTETEDEAGRLREQLEAELPSSARISLRPSGGMLLEVLPTSPFLIFSGIASHAGKER